jgi:hypothetical protein
MIPIFRLPTSLHSKLYTPGKQTKVYLPTSSTKKQKSGGFVYQVHVMTHAMDWSINMIKKKRNNNKLYTTKQVVGIHKKKPPFVNVVAGNRH